MLSLPTPQPEGLSKLVEFLRLLVGSAARSAVGAATDALDTGKKVCACVWWEGHEVQYIVGIFRYRWGYPHIEGMHRQEAGTWLVA